MLYPRKPVKPKPKPKGKKSQCPKKGTAKCTCKK